MMFFFLQKVGFFFEFVHGKYSEVGGGNLKKCKRMENSSCVCVFNAKL